MDAYHDMYHEYHGVSWMRILEVYLDVYHEYHGGTMYIMDVYHDMYHDMYHEYHDVNHDVYEYHGGVS